MTLLLASKALLVIFESNIGYTEHIGIGVGQDLQRGILCRRHAVRLELVPGAPGHLLSGLADDEGNAVLDPVHAGDLLAYV